MYVWNCSAMKVAYHSLGLQYAGLLFFTHTLKCFERKVFEYMTVLYSLNSGSRYGDISATFSILLGLVMAQAGSCQPLTMEAGMQSHINSWRICCEQSGTRRGFSLSTSVFSVPVSSPCAPYLSVNWYYTILAIYGILRQKRESKCCAWVL